LLAKSGFVVALDHDCDVVGHMHTQSVHFVCDFGSGRRGGGRVGGEQASAAKHRHHAGQQARKQDCSLHGSSIGGMHQGLESLNAG